MPAICGHQEKTWASRAKFDPSDLAIASQPSEIHKAIIKSIPLSPGYSGPPAIAKVSGPNVDKLEPAWITRGIRMRSNDTRVLLYDHGRPTEDDTLKTLALRLLKNIEDLRRIENSSRPIFFIAHSTGGLVVKMALAEASRSRNSILGDCYGVTFFSTPHRGSSHLSKPDFAHNIARVMRLSAPLPDSISRQLQLDHQLLTKLDLDFRSLATELQVWTFFETEDTNLTNEYHAPITSIKSALLNLRHEVVYPLLSDHTNCAGFGSKNLQTKESYLCDLSEAIKKALELSKTKHTEMNLEDRVKVEIIGFYEMSESHEEPIEVWSTSRSLRDLKRYGPAKLLEDRLSEINAPPRERQHLRQNTRAPTLMPNRKEVKPVLADKVSDPELGAKTSRFRRSKSKERDSQEPKPAPNLLVPGSPPGVEMKPVRRPADPIPSIAVVAEDGYLAPDISKQKRERSRERGGRTKRRDSVAAVDTTPVIFIKPDASKQRLVWIHVPFNNPTWVRVSNLVVFQGVAKQWFTGCSVSNID